MPEKYSVEAVLSATDKNFSSTMNSASDSAGKLEDKLKTGLVLAGKAALAGIAAAAAGIAKITAESVKQYANYEQQVGGVMKLYGTAGMSVEDYAKSVGKSVSSIQGEYKNLEKAQDLVLKNASQAYKTSGMSMNQYMETATSFSAALINSLGGDTVKAAQQTDVAMRAISDNVNTFGSDMQSVQNAFMGFSRQNYMMLDNLKLGYAGTKQGMEQLIKDANEYAKANGKAADLSIDSFSDVVTAIELIQEKQKIAGTTAREAATTVEGSLNMVKASWQNVLTALGSGDVDMIKEHIQGLTESVETLIKNLIPVILSVLQNLPQLITGALNPLIEQVPALLNSIIPAATQAISGLIAAVAQALPQIATTIVSQLPTIMMAGIQIIVALIQGLGSAMPELIPTMVQAIVTMVDGLINNIELLVSASLQLIEGIVQGLIAALPILIGAMPRLIQSMVTGLIKNLNLLISCAVKLVQAIVKGVVQNLPLILNAGVRVVTQLVAGILQMASQLPNAARRLISGFKSAFTSINWAQLGSNIIRGIVNGIKNGAHAIASAAKSAAKSALDAAKNFLGIHSPSRKFRDIIGKNMALGIGVGFQRNLPVNGMQRALSRMTSSLSGELALSPFSGELSESYEYNTKTTIVVPVEINGREFARVTAPYNQAENNKAQARENYSRGWR